MIKAIKEQIFVVILFALAGTANASLIGDTVDCSTSGASWACSPTSNTVTDPGVEFGLMLRTTTRAFDVDIAASVIRFDVLSSVGSILGLGPVILSDLDWVGMNGIIIGFSFLSDIPGLDASRLSFTTNSFSVDFDSLSTSSGQFLSIELETTHPVPEPTTVILMVLGMAAGIGSVRKLAA